MPHFAIQMADGSIAIMQTAGDATPEECLAKWHPDERAKVVTHQPIDPATLPLSREYRDAWTLIGNSVVHDIAKARDIQRDRLRVARAPLLAALDTAYLQADEAGDAKAKAAIAAQKQALRDATNDPAIDAAATVEDLKAITVDSLTAASVEIVSDAKSV